MFGSVIEPIKALREATDDLTSQDLDRLFDDQISTGVAELATMENRLVAMKLRLIAEADRRLLPTTEGHASAASWVADRCRLSYGSARTQLGLARDLEEMPHTGPHSSPAISTSPGCGVCPPPMPPAPTSSPRTKVSSSNRREP